MDETPISNSFDDDTQMNPIDAGESSRRPLVWLLLGVIAIGCGILCAVAFVFLQPNAQSLVNQYFPSPTGTPAPTRTPIPNLTATQRAWVKPAQSPSLGSVERVKSALDSGINNIEDFAVAFPDMPPITQPGDIYIFEITLQKSEPLVWSYGWCTTTQEILDENFAHIQLKFTLNGTIVPTGKFAIVESPRNDGSPCREYDALVNEWPQGQHQLEIRVTFTQDIDDGWNVYPAGAHTFKYIVTVQP